MAEGRRLGQRLGAIEGIGEGRSVGLDDLVGARDGSSDGEIELTTDGELDAPEKNGIVLIGILVGSCDGALVVPSGAGFVEGVVERGAVGVAVSRSPLILGEVDGPAEVKGLELAGLKNVGDELTFRVGSIEEIATG